MTFDPKTKGHLDPGAPSRRKPTSICKCLLCSTVTFLLSCIAITFVFFITKFSNRLFAPHKHLYHNTTTSLDRVANRAAVVQPLISREQTFDLAATIWLRTSNERHKDEPFKFIITAINGRKEVGKSPENEQPLSEEALFSDIIFSGVRLTDKNLFTTVNFTVPTALFRDTNLTNYDLRASVVLIPRAPSLMNFIANYSSYIPHSVDLLPVRAWPFPLGSDSQQNKTLADKAIESFGVSVPLIQFHGVQSQCTSKAQDNEDDETEEEIQPPPKKRAGSLEVTDGQPVIKSHPYIITRSQVRVLDEVRLYDRKAYNMVHKNLKKTSCGQSLIARPSRYSCKRGYRENGNWETLLRLQIPDEFSGEKRTEWAYAPFIALPKDAHGPKDLLYIPVSRENCSEDGTMLLPKEIPENTSINVTWKVSYSGRSPTMMNIGDISEDYLNFNTFNSSGTARDQTWAHDFHELSNGLKGHRFREGAHPRRRLFITSLIQPVLSFTILCLEIHYWLTRRTTVSISIFGATLVAIASITDTLDKTIYGGIANNLTVAGWLLSFLWIAISFLVVLPLQQLKIVFRVDFGWSSSWLPTLSKVQATHSERASERLEARTSLRTKIGLLLSVLAIYYLLEPHTFDVIADSLPPLETPEITGVVPASVLLAMETVGTVLQNILNWQSGTFAGGYKTSAIVTLMLHMSDAVMFIPAIVGTYDTRGSLSAHFLIVVTLALFNVWQALTLPSVRQINEEDHIE